jgi:hypothetical protein
MIERRYNGIAANFRPENKATLGMSRGEQKDPRSPKAGYGLREEEYLHLKALTRTLPQIRCSHADLRLNHPSGIKKSPNLLFKDFCYFS